MRYLAAALAFIIVILQYPLWLGKGGWLRVWDLDRQLAIQRAGNSKLQARNDALDAEVRDLKAGYEALEERARYELGMIKQDEIFFQMLQPGQSAPLVPDASAQPVPDASAQPATQLQKHAR